VGYVLGDRRIRRHSDLESTFKRAVMTYFKLLSWYLPESEPRKASVAMFDFLAEIRKGDLTKSNFTSLPCSRNVFFLYAIQL
jgi:hypothetical protein